MLRRIAQRLGALSFAAVLALALAACGGDTESTEAPTPPTTTENEKETTPASADVHYKCTKEGCEKTKTAAKGAPAPS